MWDGWLTGVRFRRLPIAINIIAGQKPGFSIKDTKKQVWKTCGGPFEEIQTIIDLLTLLELCSVNGDLIYRTKAGNTINRSIKKDDLRPLALVIIKSGIYSHQIIKLSEFGSLDDNGNFLCRMRLVQNNTPQLFGILKCWSEIEFTPKLLIPSSIFEDINSDYVVAKLNKQLGKEKYREDIGARAETHSYIYQRKKSKDKTKIIWVSEVSDTLGWDIEDRNINPVRRIEVKGSSRDQVVFYLSENEYNKSQDYYDNYEIQFWGEINLSRNQEDEYDLLISKGYPYIYFPLQKYLEDKELVMKPIKWRITT